MLHIIEFGVHFSLGIFPTEGGNDDGGRDDSGKHLFIPLDFLLAFSDPPSTEARGHILSAHNRTTEQLVTSLSMCVSGQQQHNTAVMKSVLMLSSYSLTPNNINKSVCSFKNHGHIMQKSASFYF